MSASKTAVETEKASDGFELRITGRAIRRVFMGLVAAVVAGGLVYLGLFLFGSDSFGEFIDEQRYQAVFLNDGRAYFGHVREAGNDYYELRDAFYVQQVPGEQEKDKPTQQVLPRSADLHGPESRMLIPRASVVLIENLRRDSELAKTMDGLLRDED